MFPMPRRKAFTVAIIEADAAIRSDWSCNLRRLPGCSVIEFSSGEAALKSLPWNVPDFVLVGADLPGLSGVECTRKLRKLLPGLLILMLTPLGEDFPVDVALRAGASGCLLNRIAPPAGEEEKEVSSSRAAGHSTRRAADWMGQLSPKEGDILKLLSEGFQYKEIADRLVISMDTVRTHIRRIYQKLDVHSRTDAVVKYLTADGHREFH